MKVTKFDQEKSRIILRIVRETTFSKSYTSLKKLATHFKTSAMIIEFIMLEFAYDLIFIDGKKAYRISIKNNSKL